MALASIVNFDDVEKYIDDDLTAAQRNFLKQVLRRTERAVRRFVGSYITQSGPYTHYLPRFGTMKPVGRSGLLDEQQVYLRGPLRVPEFPVRSITSIKEDQYGYFGQATNAFASGSELTSGTEYYQELQQANFNRWGKLHRVEHGWYANPGSYEIVYTAGWSADELAGNVTDPMLDASDIQLAVWKAVVDEYNKRGAGGDEESFGLGDFNVKFETGRDAGSDDFLSDDVKQMLVEFKRVEFPQ